MKYIILMLLLLFSGCATIPKTVPGEWQIDEITFQDKLEILERENKIQKQEIRYLESQLKESYKAAEIQDKIYGR